MFRRYFQSYITVKDKVVTDFYVASSVDIDSVCTEIVFSVLEIGIVPFRADVIYDIISTDSVPYLIRFIWVPSAVFMLLLSCILFPAIKKPSIFPFRTTDSLDPHSQS